MFIVVVENAIETATAGTISVPDSLATASTITLIVLLAIRVIVGAYNGPRLKFLSRFLLIIIIPLLFIFALIVVTRIMNVW